MLNAIVHAVRLVRVGFVLAREGAFGLVDPGELPALPRLGLWLARRIERPGAGDNACLLYTSDAADEL